MLDYFLRRIASGVRHHDKRSAECVLNIFDGFVVKKSVCKFAQHIVGYHKRIRLDALKLLYQTPCRNKHRNRNTKKKKVVDYRMHFNLQA